jgi:hypothetical protein
MKYKGIEYAHTKNGFEIYDEQGNIVATTLRLYRVRYIINYYLQWGEWLQNQ